MSSPRKLDLASSGTERLSSRGLFWIMIGPAFLCVGACGHGEPSPGNKRSRKLNCGFAVWLSVWDYMEATPRWRYDTSSSLWRINSTKAVGHNTSSPHVSTWSVVWKRHPICSLISPINSKSIYSPSERRILNLSGRSRSKSPSSSQRYISAGSHGN